MTAAIIARKQPCAVVLEPGTYYWCRCGRSDNQPFCDGSHAKTDLEPVVFQVEEKTTYYLCGCKQTDSPPFCDGTHGTL